MGVLKARLILALLFFICQLNGQLAEEELVQIWNKLPIYVLKNNDANERLENIGKILNRVELTDENLASILNENCFLKYEDGYIEMPVSTIYHVCLEFPNENMRNICKIIISRIKKTVDNKDELGGN